MPVGNNQKGYEAISIKPLHINQPRVYFNSIITEYSDSWSPNWSPTAVYGRMDPVSTYAGTSRELILGFRVISDTSSEARENMLKIEKLIQYQYPSYQLGAGRTKIMNSPPYFELTFLNVLDSSKATGSRLTGYINGAIQINPGFQSKEQAQFFNSSFKQLYFSDVTITLRLQVLHENTIGWTNSAFSHRNYPYGIDAGTTTETAYAPPPANPNDPANPDTPGTQPPSGETSQPNLYEELKKSWQTLGTEANAFAETIAAGAREVYENESKAFNSFLDIFNAKDNARQTKTRDANLAQRQGRGDIEGINMSIAVPDILKPGSDNMSVEINQSLEKDGK